MALRKTLEAHSLLVAEMRALGSLLACVTHDSVTSDVLEPLTNLWIQQRPTDAEDWLRYGALSKLLGKPIMLPELEASEEAAGWLFVRTTRAWLLWAAGRTEEARVALSTTVCEPLPQEGGEIHLMALGPWCRGVGALIAGNREEARRFFRRSMEVGSQLGTETNSAIQWAYVATFFEHKP